MANSSYMPLDDNGKAELLDHLASCLPKYNDILKTPDAMLTALFDDAAAWRYSLHGSDDSTAFSQLWTTFKNRLRDGGDGSGDWPQPFSMPQPAPKPVPPGIVARLRALVAWIKAQPGYTEDIGKDLWIVPTMAPIDPNSWKPQLSVQLKAGHPSIDWTKGKATALELWVDRGDGAGFVLLTISTSPPTADPAPLPAAGAVWRYKAIFRYHDEQVGQWSDVVSVTVGG